MISTIWLIMCVTHYSFVLICVNRSYVCDMWRNSGIYVYMCVIRGVTLIVTRKISELRHISHTYVTHQILRVTMLVRMRDTYECIREKKGEKMYATQCSFVCVTLFIHTCDVMHLRVSHDWLVYMTDSDVCDVWCNSEAFELQICRLNHSLQHTATHCNALQHIATHCNTLQHTTTHCNTAAHCNRGMEAADMVFQSLAATHCNTLQHTATHCNTLQQTATHTATHFNRGMGAADMVPQSLILKVLAETGTHILISFTTLQHTATHCNTLQHTVAYCSTLQHTAAQCNTLQHTATHCNTLQLVTHTYLLTHTHTPATHCKL